MVCVRGLVTRVEERRVRGTAEVSVARRGDRGGETLDLISRYVYVIGATFHHAWEDFKRRLRNVATRSDDHGGTLESLQQTSETPQVRREELLRPERGRRGSFGTPSRMATQAPGSTAPSPEVRDRSARRPSARCRQCWWSKTRQPPGGGHTTEVEKDF